MNARIKNILVADDVSVVREMLKVVLSEKGFHVMTACSGDMAEKLIQAHDFDLLILDNQMEPGPLGLELCARYNNEVPVIMISGDNIQEESMAAGAASFILRPVTASQVLTDIFRITNPKGD